MIRSTLPSLFAWLLSTYCAAQLPQYQAQVFGEEQGIGNGLIYDVFTDREQFLWIMTPYALQRFDGRNVQPYHFSTSLSHTMCAADGRIWVLAGQTLWRNRPDWQGFEQLPFDTSSGQRIRGIFQLPNQPVTLLATQGLYSWEEASHHFQRLPVDLPVPNGRQHAMRLDTCAGVLFYNVKGGGICALNVATGRAITLPFKHEFRHLLAVTADLAVVSDYLGNSYWFDFAQQEVRPIDARHYGLSRHFHKTNVQGFVPLGADRFLVSTQWGLCEYELRTDRFVPERVFTAGKPIENEKDVQRLFIDASGTVWAHIGTKVLAIKPVRNSLGLLRNYHFTAPDQWDNRIYGAANDDLGNIWFGSQFGFTKLHLSSGKITAYAPTEEATDRLSHPFVRSILYDGKYLILGPTYNGVWLFDPHTEHYRRPNYASDSVRIALEEDYIDYMATMRNGDHLVCGRFHPYRIEAHTYRVDFLHFPKDNANMDYVTQDSSGRIWFGSERSLHCLDEQYHFLFEVPVGKAVYSMYQLSEQVWMVGTEKGLRRLRLDQKTPRLENVLPILAETSIRFIFRDQLNRFWLGTSNGLYLTDTHWTTLVKFDFSDNIQSRVFNQGACSRASDNMLFLGGQNGINYFIPENIALGEHPLSVHIQSMQINDSDSILLRPAERPDTTVILQLPHFQNTLSLEIVAPYFNNAGRLHYRYRLHGQSGAWVELGTSNSFRLSDLPAGNYRLDVAATVNGQIWHTAQYPLFFRLLPPFWATWPFRLTAFMLGIALFIFFIRYRENQLKQRQARRLEVERLKSTALQYQLETEQVVNYFNRSISDKSTVEEALWDVAQQCIAQLGFEDCVIYLLDSTRQVLVQKAAWGQKSAPGYQIVQAIEIPAGQGIVGSVAQTGQAELVNDTSADTRYILDDAQRASELAVPILHAGHVIGVIDSEHSQRHFYTAWHLQILTAIASLCSNKIVLAQTEEGRRQALLEVLDNQRKAAEAKLQSLRLQMNPHFLFNALNSIQQMIMYGNSDGAALYLSKFSKLLRLVLTHSDRDFIQLREELDMLHLYLELEALRFTDDFTYTLVCPSNLDKDDYQVPPLLIQPFVENAIWHGLLHQEGLRTLHIRFDTTPDDYLYCTITDNGIGRVAARMYSRPEHPGGKGVGVGTERLQAINRQYKQQNVLTITDLAIGTKVEILFK